ncbi:hypothetical protein NGRA_3052 [Nosema granulosis]|uniref:CCHC-type domain-containing protein n=1 Tax=Nosema granulosis TaxID=83296 RepID=A0A9P6GWJ0_9MICR|nr:hypothetical protein NGRA_3052 [Nosema granulosis]
MLFRNHLYSVRKAAQVNEQAGKSNPKDKSFVDKVEVQEANQMGQPATKNVVFSDYRSSTAVQRCVFRRNMKEREVKREVFMLEGDENFEALTLRSKMTLLVKRSSDDVKNWFYDMGIEENLPDSWNEFKKSLIDHCCGSGLDNMIKYREELWSQYCIGLRSMASEKNINEEEVLKKLRKEYAPKTLQVIFYSFGISLKDVIERVEEWELFIETQASVKPRKKTFKPVKDIREVQKPKVTCYKCKMEGHYSNECKNNSAKLNSFERTKTEDCKLDTMYVIVVV